MNDKKRLLDMEECRELELDIFKKIIEICERHKLRYIVDYGTLIGAVRHGGFIPWDDDIDLSMPRPDYEVFRTVFPQEAGKDSCLELRTGMKANLALPYIQVVNKNTVTVKKGRRRAYAQSLWVDVFPVDGAGNSKEEREDVYERYWAQIRESRAIIGRYQPYLNPWKQLRQFYRHEIKKIRLGAIVRRADQIMRTYDYDDSEQIFCFCTIYGTGEKNEKSFYEDRVEIKFEGIPCMAPREYDKKLRGIYGDYMTLPPEEKRKGHEYAAYFSQM